MYSEPITLKERPDIKRIVLAAFPSYRKLKAYVSEFHPMNVNSYWDGGSKDEYAIVDLDTFRAHHAPTSHPYFDVARYGMANQDAGHVKSDRVGNVTLQMLPPNTALVSAGTFCGKPATAHVYFAPKPQIEA